MQKGSPTAVSCVVCAATARTPRTPGLPFCGPCWTRWRESGERRRVLEYGGGPASLTAVEDFIRRLRAERLNGG